MIKIRKNVFETNSSSTHSICITKTNNLLAIPEKVVFKLAYFGWEKEIYSDTEHKASYLYSAIKEIEKYDNKEKARKWLDFIGETLLKNNVDYEFIDDEKFYGIDHVYDLVDFIDAVCHSEKRLLRYLFSVESFVITGNDNSDSCVGICEPYRHEEYYKGN